MFLLLMTFVIGTNSAYCCCCSCSMFCYVITYTKHSIQQTSNSSKACRKYIFANRFAIIINHVSFFVYGIYMLSKTDRYIKLLFSHLALCKIFNDRVQLKSFA